MEIRDGGKYQWRFLLLLSRCPGDAGEEMGTDNQYCFDHRSNGKAKLSPLYNLKVRYDRYDPLDGS